MIERTTASLKESGARSVTIIHPSTEKTDFNDVLKTGRKIAVKQYTAIAQCNHNPLYKQIQNLKQNSNHHKLNELTVKNKIFSYYKDPVAAEKEWNTLKQKLGVIATIKAIKQQPNIIGKLNGGFFNGFIKESVKNNIPKLLTAEMHRKLHNLQQKNLQHLNNKLSSIINSALATKTSHLPCAPYTTQLILLM